MASETKKPVPNKRLIFIIFFIFFVVLIHELVAIPSFFNRLDESRQAKYYIGAMNRAQQQYFIEKATFTNSINLGAGIPLETDRYKYYSRSEKKIITPDYEILMVSNFSVAKKDNLQNYYGLVWATKSRTKKNLTKDEQLAKVIHCKTSSNMNLTIIPKVEFSKDFKEASCPKGMERMQ